MLNCYRGQGTPTRLGGRTFGLTLAVADSQGCGA